MISKKLYVIKALLDWVIDTGCTPYLVVDATVDGVIVPQEFIDKQGQIVFNISVNAINSFFIDNTGISFKTKFKREPFHVMVPLRAVRALVSHEQGHGLWFREEDFDEDDFIVDLSPEDSVKKKPKLEIIR